MERARYHFRTSRLAAICLILLILPSTGCVGFVAFLMHAWKGNTVPPDFSGLEGKYVAVVCVSETSFSGPSIELSLLGGAVEERLRRNIKDIVLIDQMEIAEWTDSNDWDGIDYREIGEGVGADMVIAIDLNSFTLRDGATLFKGKTSMTVSVYDMESGGDRVYYDTPPQIVYPVTGGVHNTETSATEFRRKFVEVIAHQLAKRFYEYDLKEDFAQDPTFIGT